MITFLKELPYWLRKYRVLQVVITAFLGWILYQMVGYLLSVPFSELKEWQLAPISVAVPALIAGLFKVIEAMQKPIEEDQCKHKDT